MGWWSGRALFVSVTAAVVLGCALASLAWSIHWPLVGDASLMHYVIFLVGRGMVPYRDIADINLPGSYFFEGLGMRLLGEGALAWRVYDLLLLLALAGAMLLLTPRRLWPAGMLAGGMFALIHIQDGLAQTGQRDLLVAVLLLWAYVALFAARRLERHGVWLVFASALLLGITLTIKPMYLLVAVALLCLPVKMKKSGFWMAGLTGLLLPSAICVLWLTRVGALTAFVQIAQGLIPLHAELGRRSLPYLLNHAVAPVSFLIGVWLALLVFGRPAMNRQRRELLAGAAVALAAYVMQGKGYPYHRYPLLALLLVVMETDFCAAWQERVPMNVIGGVALAAQCLILAPHAARQAHSVIRPAAPFEDALSAELRKYGPGLSGNVQCLDTFGGCVNTLYDLRLTQATGYLYDCYLFTEGRSAAVERYREGFLRAYDWHPPTVLVLTDQYCFGEPRGFNRLGKWPALAEEIGTHYTQRVEWQSAEPQHWFSRSEMPSQFRVYVRDH